MFVLKVIHQNGLWGWSSFSPSIAPTKKDKLCRLETLGIEIILLTSQVSYEGMYKSEYHNK